MLLFTKSLKFGIGIGVLLTLIGMPLIQNLGWAANIMCDNTNPSCRGTPGDDTIKDGNGNRIIDGLSGNDVINAGPGDDDVCGSGGDDKIDLGNGNDRGIADGTVCKGDVGRNGADVIRGGPGNDILTHGPAWETYSDGFKDDLDCGQGVDVAFANLTVDHDVVTNCEYINYEYAPVP